MSGVFNYQFRLNVVLIFKIDFLIYYYVWYTNQCFMLYKVISAVVYCGPQHRSFGMSAYNNVQVGETAPTLKLAESHLRITCKLAGPNIVELDPQFLQTLQVGGASNSEAGEKSASMNIIKKLGNKMLPNFIFKIINPI
ncbi:hypothetical protein DVJ93_14015 [Staphylococcus aureus]|uniref:Nitrogen regulation protein NIFR3 n=1 Tax=Staphylococcus aureus TaxID=1280 RepID=A0A7Z1N5R4_STAAU|nr:hypothetical protein [Staphylococcus aureus]PPJ65365.1 hypothetical protein CV018_14630 [Staphylococcus aureus]PPJ75555.1 hypothetical protein CV021_04645 [Staphylococcus aureus]